MVNKSCDLPSYHLRKINKNISGGDECAEKWRNEEALKQEKSFKSIYERSFSSSDLITCNAHIPIQMTFLN